VRATVNQLVYCSGRVKARRTTYSRQRETAGEPETSRTGLRRGGGTENQESGRSTEFNARLRVCGDRKMRPLKSEKRGQRGAPAASVITEPPPPSKNGFQTLYSRPPYQGNMYSIFYSIINDALVDWGIREGLEVIFRSFCVFPNIRASVITEPPPPPPGYSPSAPPPPTFYSGASGPVLLVVGRFWGLGLAPAKKFGGGWGAR